MLWKSLKNISFVKVVFYFYAFHSSKPFNKDLEVSDSWFGGSKMSKDNGSVLLTHAFAQAAFWLVLRFFYVFILASFLRSGHKCVVVCSSSWED